MTTANSTVDLELRCEFNHVKENPSCFISALREAIASCVDEAKRNVSTMHYEVANFMRGENPGFPQDYKHGGWCYKFWVVLHLDQINKAQELIGKALDGTLTEEDVKSARSFPAWNEYRAVFWQSDEDEDESDVDEDEGESYWPSYDEVHPNLRTYRF